VTRHDDDDRDDDEIQEIDQERNLHRNFEEMEMEKSNCERRRREGEEHACSDLVLPNHKRHENENDGLAHEKPCGEDAKVDSSLQKTGSQSHHMIDQQNFLGLGQDCDIQIPLPSDSDCPQKRRRDGIGGGAWEEEPSKVLQL
jgi:hypothetical protein